MHYKKTKDQEKMLNAMRDTKQSVAGQQQLDTPAKKYLMLKNNRQ